MPRRSDKTHAARQDGNRSADSALSRAREAARLADEHLREAIEAMPHGVVFLDPDGRYILWNRQYAEIYHRSADLFHEGARLADTLRTGVERGDYPEAVGCEEQWLEQRLSLLDKPGERHEQLLADGRCIMIEERKTADGGTIGLRVDITEMKAREEGFRLLFESNPAPLLVYDPLEECVRSANAAAAAHFGYGAHEIAGLAAERLFAADEWPEARRVLATSCSDKERFWRQTARDGGALESVLFTRQSMIDGRLSTIVSVFDVTERRKAEARIAHMARHDDLTGLANRAHCHERLQQMLAGLRDRGGTVAIAMIDLDNFKQINDSYGHHVGDVMLAEAARRMRALVPRNNALLCRLGGDEFAVVCQAKTREKIDLIARSIIAVIAEPFTAAGSTLHIGATIGIAIAPQDGVEAGHLLRYADLALYAAKADKRGSIRRFEPEMDEAAQEKSRLENDLRKAIRNAELVVHYQPQIHLSTGAIEGYEALLRWNHPTRGLLFPDSFIPLAEEVGLIDVVGQYVLQTACREAARWPAGVSLAVNASPLQFQGGNLLTIIVQALAMSGLPASRLEIEITEAVLIDRSPQVASLLDSIRKLGVGISMDDFGTGYSSLSYLLSYPFTKIKIDKSFILGLREANAKAVVSAIVGLGNSLGITVTAEGIEAPEHLAYLRDIGCDQGQGYLFGRAIPADQLWHDVLSRKTA